MHYSLAILLLISTFNSYLEAKETSETEGKLLGCKDLGQCCQGKESSCSVSNRITIEGEPDSWKNCYCDSTCADTGDCCHDHKEFCKPEDCLVGEWSDWTTCSKLCGQGNATRTRQITQEEQNGGLSCPPLEQMTRCIGDDCNTKRDVRRRALKETGRILPIQFATYRTDIKYDIRRGIRKNLYNHYHKSTLAKATYCAFYKVSYSRPHCHRSHYGKWAKTLKRGLRMCMECQPSAMHPNGHCQGDGVRGRDTRWKAVGVSACSGWWRLDSEPKECTCNSKLVESFIFV